jgi:O-antigen ligase
MAFFLSLLFIVTAYVTPDVLWGPLAEFHIEIILALLAFIASLPNIAKSRIFALPQAYACVAFTLAVPVSIAAGGWFGGALVGLYGFLPVVFAFFLAAANFRTRLHLQLVVLALWLGSVYFMVNGLLDLQNHVIPSQFLYGDGELRRLRGLGFVFDPNDFSQVMVSLLPLIFLWKTKNTFLNVFIIGIPVATLITGMFFTHSRGAALALMAVIVVVLRRKIGTVPAAVLAGALFAASLAVGWSGGRDVSMEAGADRLDAWSTGFQFIKQHPIFGVGSGRFAELNQITAHNTVIVCAAEIGLPGFCCWVLFVFTALRNGTRINASETSDETDADDAAIAPPAPLPHLRPRSLPMAPMGTRMALAGPPMLSTMPLRTGLGPMGPRRPEEAAPVADAETQESIRSMARLLVASLAGFLVAGWFLSRALSIWLFLYCGMMHAVVRMAMDAGMRPKLDPPAYLIRWSLVVAVGLLVLVFVILKFRALTGG